MDVIALTKNEKCWGCGKAHPRPYCVCREATWRPVAVDAAPAPAPATPRPAPKAGGARLPKGPAAVGAAKAAAWVAERKKAPKKTNLDWGFKALKKKEKKKKAVGTSGAERRRAKRRAMAEIEASLGPTAASRDYEYRQLKRELERSRGR